MATRDARVDAYIRNAPEYARPILTRLRKVVHAACPDVVEGTKWSSPHFDYKGIFCSMAAFKQHAMLGFWKHALIAKALTGDDAKALARCGRLTSEDDLPSDTVPRGSFKPARD